MGHPKTYWRSKLNLVTAVFLLICIPATTIASYIPKDSIIESLEYISAHQDPSSGGIIEVDNDEPSEMISAWSAIAFNSAGYSSDSVISSLDNPSLNQYLQSSSIAYSVTTDIERYILTQAANNSSIGDNYIQQLVNATDSSGLIGEDINSTIFGVLAYSAAGLTPPEESVEYIINAQETDGCWNSGWSCETNITSQAIMALIASGIEKNSSVIIEAENYLQSMHIPDGGVKYDASEWTTTSDAFSDAYTLQALNAIGLSLITSYWQEHWSEVVEDIATLRRSDGSYDFSSEYGAVNPVWTTSIVLIGITGYALPIIGSDLVSFQTKTTDNTIVPETITTTSTSSTSSDSSSSPTTDSSPSSTSNKSHTNKIHYYVAKASDITSAPDTRAIDPSSVKGIYYDSTYQPKNSWWQRLMNTDPFSVPGVSLYLSIAVVEAIIIGWLGALLLRKKRHA